MTEVGTMQTIPTLGPTTFVGLAVTSHVDGTNYTATFDSVSVNPANAPPTVATPAAASPNPAPGTTTALSVLGADDGGEAALIHTWSTTGSPPAPVTFSANGTNAAKSTTATPLPPTRRWRCCVRWRPTPPCAAAPTAR